MKEGNVVVVRQGLSTLSRLRIFIVMAHSFEQYPLSEVERMFPQWWCGHLLLCFLWSRSSGVLWLKLMAQFDLIVGKGISSPGSKNSVFPTNPSLKILVLHLLPSSLCNYWRSLFSYTLNIAPMMSMILLPFWGTRSKRWKFCSPLEISILLSTFALLPKMSSWTWMSLL